MSSTSLSPSSSSPDSTQMDEDQRQLLDLDKQRQVIRQRLMTARSTANVKSKLSKRSELCLMEIGPMDEKVKIYKAIGRAFFISEMNETKRELAEIVAKSKDDIENLSVLEKKLIDELDSVENSIEEIAAKLEK